MSVRKSILHVGKRQQARRRQLQVAVSLENYASSVHPGTVGSVCIGSESVGVESVDQESVDQHYNDPESLLDENEVENENSHMEYTGPVEPGDVDVYQQLHNFSGESLRDDASTSVLDKQAMGLQVKMILKRWCLGELNVPNDAVNRLLKNLHEVFPELPKNVGTLLCSGPQTYAFTQFENGTEYVHIHNWIGCVTSWVENHWAAPNPKMFSLGVNIDGLQLFDGSSNFHTYPILLRVNEYPKKIFTAGVFCTNKFKEKGMADVNTLLSSFLKDLVHLLENGIHTKFGTFTFDISGPFICDSIARADLKRIKHHNGKHSCERCDTKGSWSFTGHHMTFPKYGADRTSDSFYNRRDPSHHHSQSNSDLESIGVDMVAQFVLDSMHCVYQGVTKRLLTRWIKSPKTNKTGQISRDAANRLCGRILKASEDLPSDFNRKLEGGTENLKVWKATEYRLFLLYVGVVVLKGSKILSRARYHGFLKLSVAIRLLSCDNQASNLVFIRKLLMEFVQSCEKEYTTEFISSNVHNLVHLCDDYAKYGNLENISAFPFESFLGRIKNSVRSGFKPLNQVAKFVHLQNSLSPADEESKLGEKVTSSECIQDLNVTIVKKLNVRNFTLTAKGNDKFLLLKNGNYAIIVEIVNFGGHDVITIKELTQSIDFFSSPISSKKLGIAVVSEFGNNKTILPDEIFAKCVRLRFKKKVVYLTLIHTMF